MYTFNPSTQESEAGGALEASLVVYRGSYRAPRATQGNTPLGGGGNSTENHYLNTVVSYDVYVYIIYIKLNKSYRPF